jgi:alginate O-acetyltransferase complex protein AlgI
MSIASQSFLLLFLPISLLLYYRVFRGQRQKLWFLVIASYLFYVLAGWKFVLVLLGLSALTYWLARTGRFGLGIVANLLALGLFKYWNFGIETAHQLAGLVRLEFSTPFLDLGLPLGISFYVFKHIGYLVEVKNRHYPASANFVAFTAFSAFFPQVGAGPITDFAVIRQQFDDLPESLPAERAYQGLVYLTVGLIKKALIANLLAGAAGRSILEVSGAFEAWYLVLAFAMQLYFDFSGYTDMALGLGLLFGIQLPANFNNPYLSADPAQFWERWHISLSTWFRHYLFFPISRLLLRKWDSRRKETAQIAANLATMSLVGLWHGAGWTYLLWGFYHGVLLSLNAWWKRWPRISLPGFVQRCLFLLAVLVGWAIFLCPDLATLLHLLAQMSGWGRQLQASIFQPATPMLLIALTLAFSGRAEAADLAKPPASHRAWYAALLGGLLALSLFFLGQKMEFIYAQF